MSGGDIALALRAAVLVALVASPALADSWAGPRVSNVFSDDGRHFVRITPGESVGDTVGFAGARKGAYARGEFYERQPDRSYARVAEVSLRNPVAPVDALVSKGGYLITFDNWHNAGYGVVIAVYGPRGQPIAGHALEALYGPERLARIPTSVSSRWWRCPPLGYVDPGEQTRVYIREHFGGTFVVELATGRHEYHPGTASCPRP